MLEKVNFQKKDRQFLWLILAFLLPFSLYILNLGLLSESHLIITYVPISLLCSYGIVQILNLKSKISVAKYALIILFMISLLIISLETYISPEKKISKELDTISSKLKDYYKDSAILVSDYQFGMAFGYKTDQEDNYFSLWRLHQKFWKENHGDGDIFNRLQDKFWVETAFFPNFYEKNSFQQILAERPIYFVDYLYIPNRISKIFISEKLMEEKSRKSRRMTQFKNYLENYGRENFSFVKVIDSPLHPVYMLKIN